MYGLYWYAVILLVVFIVSFDFHFFNEAKEVYFLDVTFSSILMLSNFALLFMAHWSYPFSLIAVLCALLALLFYFQKSKRKYYINHSLWHLSSAGVCMFCLMALISVT